ncbi:hypothetical protein [Streptomyces sp. SUK 48]|uniref:hypothetical protein n=1 Tax=Streptomyces sp. SUK 48 TaxID=2582831 RepID=UPI00129B5772|nr:hypothetical protein [Streptomyces sp. SUK 48]
MAETRIRTRTGLTGAAEPVAPGGWFAGLRRGRHRKPRPRRALLAAGGLLLAAGALGLVRMSPESGVGAPGTAAAEPRLDPGGPLASTGPGTGASRPGGPEAPATTDTGTLATGPLAPPSTAADLAGRTPAPTPTGAATTPGNPGGSGDSGGSDGSAGGVPPAPGKSTAPSAPPRPSAPAPPAPPAHPAPPTTPAPAPTHGAPAPAPGGLCLPIIALCVDVDVLGGHGGQGPATAPRSSG